MQGGGWWDWKTTALIEDVFYGIQGLAIHLDHIMQVRTRGKSGTADQPNDLSTLHPLSLFD
jgi:hypothetical protein